MERIGNYILSSKKKLLIIDDDPISSKILEFSLNSEHDIWYCKGAMEALEFMKSNVPDLILLDLFMPEMNGFEACKRIKADSKWSQIPIIFITSGEDESCHINAFEVGAVDYVTKPFSIPVVQARIRTHLKLKEHLERVTNESRKRKELLHMLSPFLLYHLI